MRHGTHFVESVSMLAYNRSMNTVIEKRSAGGIVHSEGKFLVIKAIPYDETILPKGTIEEGETPEQTAVREVLEETGYKTSITAKLGEISYEFDEDDGKRYRKTVYYYLMDLIDKDAEPTPDRQEDEDFENIWLTVDEAMLQLTHDNSKNMLQKALEILEK